jgi:hypothetical protein
MIFSSVTQELGVDIYTWAIVVIPTISCIWPPPSLPLFSAGHNRARRGDRDDADVIGTCQHCRPVKPNHSCIQRKKGGGGEGGCWRNMTRVLLP